MTDRPRVLVAIMVYNGRSVVERALASASLLEPGDAEVDILVLDDASPAPGFSGWLEEACRTYGFQYYRSPRNLGIVRNFNLGLGRAVEAGYTHVILSNSDVVYPRGLVTRMLAAEASASDRVAAVQAWSNDMSSFSLPNRDPDRFLSTQDAVDGLATVFAAEFGDTSVTLPVGVGFCIMLPTCSVQTVGLMDPVFGRGYCEESDWCLRARSMGLEVVLAPSAFVYHAGRGSTVDAGLLRSGEVTVSANEELIDFRYPAFRDEVDQFISSRVLDGLIERARSAIMRGAGAAEGYDLVVSWIETESPPERLRALINPGPDAAHVSLAYRGFDHWVLFDDGDGPAAVERALGRAPDRVSIVDVGIQADLARAAFPSSVVDVRIGYPTRI